MGDNGKWTLAFWVMTAVCFGGIIFVGNQAIAIDLRARTAAEAVDARSLLRFSENKASIYQLMKENAESHTRILLELEAIKGAVNGKPDRVRM